MRKRTGDKDQKICDAALKLFATNGFAKSKIIDVANAAGIATGSVYLYFPSKTHIIDAIFTRFWEEMCSEIEKIVATDCSWQDKLTAPSVVLLERLAGDPLMAQLYANEHVNMLNSKKKMEWIAHYHKFLHIGDEFAKAVTQEGLINGTINNFVISHFLIGGIRHLLHAYISNNSPISKEELVQSTKNLIISGLSLPQKV
jgi:TetR/AcrR family fatty acid metabolism transcriptional regulator